jgi:hypothetical protein
MMNFPVRPELVEWVRDKEAGVLPFAGVNNSTP